MLRRLIAGEDGQALVEYALIAGALIVGLYVGASGVIKVLGGLYQGQRASLQKWHAP